MEPDTLERWQAASLLVLLSVACAAVTPLRGPDVEFALSLWALLTVLPAAVFAGWRLYASGIDSQRAPLAWVAIAVLWVATSGAFSEVPHLSVGQALLIWSAGGAFLVATVLTRAGFGAWVLVMCALVSAGYAIGIGFAVDICGEPAWRFRDRNVLADGVVLGVCAILALSVRLPRNRAVCSAAAVALALCAWAVLELLTARVGIVLLVIVTLVAMGLLVADRRHHLMVSAWFTGVAFGVMVAVFSDFGDVSATPDTGAPEWLERVNSAAIEGSLALRGQLLAGAATLVPSHPLFGSGLQSFLSRFESIQSPSMLHAAAMVHNDYLQVAVELGLPAAIGLASLVVLVVAVWFAAARRVLFDTFDARILAGTIVLLGPLALFAHAFVNFPLYDGQLLFTGAGMLGVGLCWVRWDEPHALRRFAHLSGILAIGALLAVLFSLHSAVLLARSSVVLEREPILPGVLVSRPTIAEAFSVATELREAEMPGGRAAFEAGRILVLRWESDPEAEAVLAAAGVSALAEAVERDPYEPEYAVQLARALWLTGAPIEARRTVLENAIALRPKDARTYLSLVAHEMRAGNADKARQVAAERWLPWCRHGAFRRAETSDLLAIAREGGADPDAWNLCASRLARHGILASDPNDVRGRLAPAQPG